ncbi:hypothetical protein PG991_009584 [Apiospora marii]|uniref:SnoaL-like domain-containing protein n=1 Tax=Apiospora marii TaxID=335849 RepID=A0ABR1RJN5_9PEZI
MSLEDFLQRRQAGLTAAFESGDVPKILEYYDPDLSFSDHAWKAVDKTYDEFVEFLRSTYQTSLSLRMETHGITGTKEFCAWEWTLRIVADTDDPIRGLLKGKEVVLRGCSLHWWRLQPGEDGGEVSDWRIVKEADYACH